MLNRIFLWLTSSAHVYQTAYECMDCDSWFVYTDVELPPTLECEVCGGDCWRFDDDLHEGSISKKYLNAIPQRIYA